MNPWQNYKIRFMLNLTQKNNLAYYPDKIDVYFKSIIGYKTAVTVLIMLSNYMCPSVLQHVLDILSQSKCLYISL